MAVTIQIARSATPTFPTSPVVGQLFVDILNGKLYCWSGTSWGNITQTGGAGPAGSGIQGPIGAPGGVGPTTVGPVGPPGVPG